jgi:hypothetical protein
MPPAGSHADQGSVEVFIGVEQHRLSALDAFLFFVPADGGFNLITMRIGVVIRCRQVRWP